MKTPFLAFLLFSAFLAQASATAVWQYSVPVPSLEGRRAYLWIPPECPRIRGLVIACQNMLEKPLFERPAFRSAAARAGLGLVLIFPGHDKGPDDDKETNHPPRSSLDIFLNPNYPKGNEDPAGAGVDLQKMLDALATESGYPEIRYAPLMPVGHSSAGSFVWHLYRWDPSRIFAMMPFKTGIKHDGPQDIPIFNVESEWFDLGQSSNNVSSKPSDISSQLQARGNGANSLFGLYVSIGSGHCDVNDDCIPVVGLWLKKAADARIPRDAPLDKPVALKPVRPETGWLLDPATLGRPGGGPYSYATWKGDPRKAFWYLDEELARAVQDGMAAQVTRKPQQINFIKDGVAPATGGMFSFSPKWLDDGATFQVQATFLDHMTKTDLFPPEMRLEHSATPIFYRVNSGGLVQVGPDTFRVCPHAGPLLPQGNPWEPTIVAYNLGDNQFRPTERPGHVNVNIFNRDGAPQTLDFPKIPNFRAGKLAPMKLTAKASSGLPVQWGMVSGPATIEGNVLTFGKFPVRTKYPVRFLVFAYQWGRPVDPKVQSVGPQVQEFFVTR